MDRITANKKNPNAEGFEFWPAVMTLGGQRWRNRGLIQRSRRSSRRKIGLHGNLAEFATPISEFEFWGELCEIWIRGERKSRLLWCEEEEEKESPFLSLSYVVLTTLVLQKGRMRSRCFFTKMPLFDSLPYFPTVHLNISRVRIAPRQRQNFQILKIKTLCRFFSLPVHWSEINLDRPITHCLAY